MENKTIVCIIIYDRFENLKRWIHCWKQCDKTNAELVVIHNQENPVTQDDIYNLCAIECIPYFPRKNIGYDIGAFQDVCRNRIENFPAYDNLLWITDDTFPMQKDFVSVFVNKLNEKGVGISCMEISNERARHIRTTGFCIKKTTAEKLTFPAEPIITKEDCYQFEHRAGKGILLEQILTLGLKAEIVADLPNNPLWDIGNRKYLKRMDEHERIFYARNKIVFICPIYNQFPQIIPSLICQTHQNWELILVHDGECDDLTPIFKMLDLDERIKFHSTEKHVGKWGHYIRRDELEKLKSRNDVDYVVITNADNQHFPSYCEFFLKGFDKNLNAVAIYCDKMVHSYIGWGVLDCFLKIGFIDCAGVMIKKDVACEIGWRDVEGHSSDWVYFEDVIKKYGKEKFLPIKGCLFSHN